MKENAARTDLLFSSAPMSGTKKITLFVIRKAKTPRWYKNVKTVPTEYDANKKIKITSEMYTNWLWSLDRKFHHQMRKVPMIVDKCPAHPKVQGLNAIKLSYCRPKPQAKRSKWTRVRSRT